jgi:twitching motility protein PilT
MFDIDAALMKVIEVDGSDLHLKVPSRPIIRRHGKLLPIPDTDGLRPDDTEGTLFHMLTDEAKLESFRVEREVDFSYSIPGVARFRVNAFVQRGSVSLVCRAIPFQIKSSEELLLPSVIPDIADEERGLILMTGTTGSGKSTTLAAMIDHINSRYAKHIVTIEDPVEFLHRDKLSIINQREVGEDTASFARALRRVLRQDPDVILVGEMRDEETVRTALSAATSSSRRSTPSTRPSPSTASSTSSRRPSSARPAPCWPARSRRWCRSGSCRPRTASAGSPAARSCA